MKSINKVALRKESVDRNDNARLLWYITDVALRKESVDRNIHGLIEAHPPICRSPQGERG